MTGSPVGVRVPHLRVVWHPDNQEGAWLAEAIFRTFQLDPQHPLDPSLGLDVTFGWVGEGEARGVVPRHNQPPADSQPVLVLLVDNLMVAEPDRAFAGAQGGLTGVVRRWTDDEDTLLLPVALSDHAFRLHPDIGAGNYIRLADLPAVTPGELDPKTKKHGRPKAPGLMDEPRTRRLVSHLTHELARSVLLGQTGTPNSAELRPAPVTLFLSHAKSDGGGVAGDLLEFLARNSPVQAFHDSYGIAPGEAFEEQLHQAIDKCVLVVLHTDAWASRPWCRWEALTARRGQRPIVVVDAVEGQAEQSFPYLGNAPRIRWKGPESCDQIVDAAVQAALRHALDLRRLSILERAAKQVAKATPSASFHLVPHQPDLLDGLQARKSATAPTVVLLHPDPPLGAQDRQLFTDHLADVTLVSAGEARAGIQRPDLKGRLIQLSVSETGDGADVGAGPVHIDAMQLVVARAILDHGAQLSYGGDLRDGGFTHLLFALVEAANRRAVRDKLHPIVSIAGWPGSRSYQPQTWAAFRQTAVRYRLEQPDDPLIDLEELTTKRDAFEAADGPAQRYAWSRGLTAMRHVAVGLPAPGQVDLHPEIPPSGALIALGGRTTDFAGTVPGVFEEIALSCLAKRQVYLCAGFGGATALAAAILHLPQAPITEQEAWRILHRIDIEHAEVHAWAGADHPLPTAVGYAQAIVDSGPDAVTALGDQLSLDQHAELAGTTDPDRVVHLLLAGLRKPDAARPPPSPC